MHGANMKGINNMIKSNPQKVHLASFTTEELKLISFACCAVAKTLKVQFKKDPYMQNFDYTDIDRLERIAKQVVFVLGQA